MTASEQKMVIVSVAQPAWRKPGARGDRTPRHADGDSAVDLHKPRGCTLAAIGENAGLARCKADVRNRRAAKL